LSEEQTPQVFVFFSQRSGQRKSRAGCSRFSEPFGSTRFELRLVSWTLLGTAVVLFVTVVLPARIHAVLDKEVLNTASGGFEEVTVNGAASTTVV